MKKVCLSLATLVALSTSAFGASTLAEAFSNGKVYGDLEINYFNAKRQKGEADLTTLGFSLGYSTEKYNGFQFNAEVQSSHSPWADDDAKAVFNNDQYGSGEVLSVFNLSYDYQNTHFKVGRMYMDTPLVASGQNRAILESFESAMIVNKDIPNTILTAAYISKVQNRTDWNGDIGSFDSVNVNRVGGPNGDFQKMENGAYTIAVKTQPISGLNVQLAYLDEIDLINNGYALANYKINDMFDVGGQYYYSKEENKESANAISGKVGLKLGKAYLFTSVSKVSDGATTLDHGLGNGTDRLMAGTITYSYLSYYPNTTTYSLAGRYNFDKNASIFGKLTKSDNDKTGKDKLELDVQAIEAKYLFTSGFLKDIELRAVYEHVGGDLDLHDLRTYITYRF